MNNIVQAYKSEKVSVSKGYILTKSENGEYHISLDKDMSDVYEEFPSRIVSNVLGIQLHEEWVLSFLQDSTKREYTQFSKRRYDELIIRNPKLLTLHDNICGNDERLQKDLWHGAITRYNVDDLSYFLSFEWSQRPAWIGRAQDELENHLKFSFQWVASPETLNKIIHALNKGEIKKLDLTLDNLNFY